MRHNDNSLMILHNTYTESFEESSLFKKWSGYLFKKFEYDTETVYLFNIIIDLYDKDSYDLDIPDEKYFFIGLDEKVAFMGNLIEPLDRMELNVYGAITFILNGLETSEYNRLKKFYDFEILDEYPELLSLFEDKDLAFFENFIENYDEYTGDDPDIHRFWAILDELTGNVNQDYGNILDELTYQYAFKKLGLTTETIDESETIICSLNGTVDILTYLTYLDFLMDELDELQDYDFQFGYSIWSEDHNLSLFEELGIDDGGEYISYPSLYYKNYQCEPVTGYWYDNTYYPPG